MRAIELNISISKMVYGSFKVYSKEMQCEFVVKESDLAGAVQKLTAEWINMREDDVASHPYRVWFGKTPSECVFYKDCSSLSEQTIELWAQIKSPCPQTAWVFQNMDGWMSNLHMKGQPLPENLKPAILKRIDWMQTPSKIDKTWSVRT